jgi:glucose/arabinose dehydrogenase
MKPSSITSKQPSKYHLRTSALAILVAGLTFFPGVSVVAAPTPAKAALAALAVPAPLPLEKLNLPAGFSIDIYAHVENARQMALGANGEIYVGSLRAGKVHVVQDTDGDFKADQVQLVAEGLNLPSGLATRNGDLYVGAVNEILVYRDIAAQLAKPGAALPTSEVVTNTLPEERHHGWKYLEFGPDGYLYIPVGAPCNICLSDKPVYASILRMNVDAKPAVLEPYVQGVRNTVGFDWHPDTHELWFTDNGRDMLGDAIPPCELNHVTAAGQHFGYPFFHGASIADPEFGAGKTAADYIEPALALDPHVAPLGMMFYTGKMLPEHYRKQIIIPEHGSWNRSPEAGHTGHRLTVAVADAEGNMSYEVLVDGWLQDNVAWGRPADLLQLADGSILISDDKANVIYRLSYQP